MEEHKVMSEENSEILQSGESLQVSDSEQAQPNQKSCKSQIWRGRSIALIVVFVLFISGMFVVQGINALGVNFPQWTSVGQARSALEARNYQKLWVSKPMEVFDGTFQSRAESWAADRVPLRDGAIYGHAWLQRISILEMADIVGYDVYPTFFGSKVAYSETYDALYDIPTKVDESTDKTLARAVKAYNAFAEKYPNLNIVVSSAPRSGSLSYGPVNELVTNNYNIDYITENFLDKLDSSITVADVHPETYEGFLESWYRTDHHWNIKGAYRGYCMLSEALGNGDDVVEAGDLIEVEDPVFYGALARRGLFLDVSADNILDYEFDIPELQVKADELPTTDVTVLWGKGMYDDGTVEKRIYTNHYGKYFHINYGDIVITNPSNTDGKSLFLVGDSYSNTIERLFACNYSRVYKHDPRYQDNSKEQLAAELADTDDVVFFMIPSVMFGDEMLSFLEEMVNL